MESNDKIIENTEEEINKEDNETVDVNSKLKEIMKKHTDEWTSKDKTEDDNDEIDPTLDENDDSEKDEETNNYTKEQLEEAIVKAKRDTKSPLKKAIKEKELEVSVLEKAIKAMAPEDQDQDEFFKNFLAVQKKSIAKENGFDSFKEYTESLEQPEAKQTVYDYENYFLEKEEEINNYLPFKKFLKNEEIEVKNEKDFNFMYKVFKGTLGTTDNSKEEKKISEEFPKLGKQNVSSKPGDLSGTKEALMKSLKRKLDNR